jgi:hypothetical protein
MNRRACFLPHFGRSVELMLVTVTPLFIACSQTIAGPLHVYPVKKL